MTEISTQFTSKVDPFDDLTNSSSILEFLNQEKQCLDLDNGSEIDVDSLFEEINRLSDNTDKRSVDEILKEAELLMNNDTFDLLNSSRQKTPPQNPSNATNIKSATLPRSAQNISKESTPRDMRENDELRITTNKLKVSLFFFVLFQIFVVFK